MYIEGDKKSWLIVKVGVIFSMRYNVFLFFNQKFRVNFLIKFYFMYVNCVNCDVYSM